MENDVFVTLRIRALELYDVKYYCACKDLGAHCADLPDGIIRRKGLDGTVFLAIELWQGIDQRHIGGHSERVPLPIPQRRAEVLLSVNDLLHRETVVRRRR